MQGASRKWDLTLTIQDLLVEAICTHVERSAEDLGWGDAAQAPGVIRPPKPEMGDLAFPCFPLAKVLHKAPPQIAIELIPVAQARLTEAAAAGEIPALATVEAIGPYLNLRFEAGSLATFVTARIAACAPPYGAPLPASGQSTMVEYSAPNTNKPLHLGHMRNNLLGLSLCNLLEAAGEEVIPVNLINDRGVHIAQSMLGYRKWGAGQTPEKTGQKGDHFVGEFYVRFSTAARAEDGESAPLMEAAHECLRQWEAGDPETRTLWGQMNAWVYAGFDETYGRIGCAFKKWYRESETYKLGKEIVADGLARGLFVQQEDGSIWAPLEEDGLQDKILQRSDGTSVYITQDLGTARHKFDDFNMDRSIYVVGSEQLLHFKMLFTILKKLGYAWAEHCHHLSYGLVTLPRGMGKLKSREGRTVDADELLDALAAIAKAKATAGGYVSDADVDIDALADAIGQGALKMYLLQVSAEKNIVFDPDTTLDFEGDTGPAVQYSHARIRSITRKALAEGKITEDDLVLADIPWPFADLGTGAPVEAPAEAPWRTVPMSAWTRATDAEAPPASRAVGLRSERIDPALLINEAEQRLSLELAFFPHALGMAAAQLSPSPVAGYLLDLTKAYARFYHNCPVLRAESEALMRARLHLSLAVATTLKRGLALLGIRAPDAM